VKKTSNSSLEQKKKAGKTKQQNKTETEFAAGFGNKKLEGPDRPST
jgi:hypothetical protein